MCVSWVSLKPTSVRVPSESRPGALASTNLPSGSQIRLSLITRTQVIEISSQYTILALYSRIIRKKKSLPSTSLAQKGKNEVRKKRPPCARARSSVRVYPPRLRGLAYPGPVVLLSGPTLTSPSHHHTVLFCALYRGGNRPILFVKCPKKEGCFRGAGGVVRGPDQINCMCV